MRLSKFTLSDDDEEFEGYTDGTLWNGWISVCFTPEQVIDFMKTTPYDYRFEHGNRNDYGLVIYWDDGEEYIPCTPLPTDDGDILEGFFIELEFMEVEEE
jgi:hypothetical protein